MGACCGRACGEPESETPGPPPPQLAATLDALRNVSVWREGRRRGGEPHNMFAQKESMVAGLDLLG